MVALVLQENCGSSFDVVVTYAFVVKFKLDAVVEKSLSLRRKHGIFVLRFVNHLLQVKDRNSIRATITVFSKVSELGIVIIRVHGHVFRLNFVWFCVGF